MIFSGASVVVSLKRRSCRTEERYSAFEAGAVDGGVASVVARRFFLLVARLLLFVDDYEAEILERRKNRGARADYDACFATTNAPPLAGALDVRQAAMQDGNAGAEAGADETSDPERQRDFGDQNERG